MCAAVALEWMPSTVGGTHLGCALGISGRFLPTENQLRAPHHDHGAVVLKTSISAKVIFSDPPDANPRMKNDMFSSLGAILVVERGGNTFTAKYEQAMNVGASALIIANNVVDQPHSVISIFGRLPTASYLTSANATRLLKGQSVSLDDRPPCIMISHAAYLKLKADNPQVMSLTPVTSQHLGRITSADLAALVRSCAVFGHDSLLRDALKEAHRRDCDTGNDGSMGVPTTQSGTTAGSVYDNSEEGFNGYARQARDNSKVINCPSASAIKTIGDINMNANRSPSSLSVTYAILNDREVGRGAAALHLAVESGQPACVSLLLRAGANTELIKDDGYTALQVAADVGVLECATLLVDAGAYLEHPHTVGWTALHIAAKAGAIEVISLLLEGGANIHARATDGCSALHVACIYGRLECVAVLLYAGANATAACINGTTPFMFAVSRGHIDCAAVLKQHVQDERTRRRLARKTDKEKKKSFLPTSGDGDFERHATTDATTATNGTPTNTTATTTATAIKGEGERVQQQSQSQGAGGIQDNSSVRGEKEKEKKEKKKEEKKKEKKKEENKKEEKAVVDPNAYDDDNEDGRYGVTDDRYGVTDDRGYGVTDKSPNITESNAEGDEGRGGGSMGHKWLQWLDNAAGAHTSDYTTRSGSVTNVDGVANTTTTRTINNAPTSRSSSASTTAGAAAGTAAGAAPRLSPSCCCRDIDTELELLYLDLGRCCFPSYRSGERRIVLEKVALSIIQNGVVVVERPRENASTTHSNRDDRNPSIGDDGKNMRNKNKQRRHRHKQGKDATSISGSEGRQDGDDEKYSSSTGGGSSSNAPANGVSRRDSSSSIVIVVEYKQGLLSLLAPIIEACMTFFPLSSSSSPSSSPASVTADMIEGEEELIQQLFGRVLLTFPSLHSYFSPGGNNDVFTYLFDQSMMILRHWVPEIYNTFIWRGFSLSLLAMPWACTLLADVLPLKEVLALWSALFECLGGGSVAGVEQQQQQQQQPQITLQPQQQLVQAASATTKGLLDNHTNNNIYNADQCMIERKVAAPLLTDKYAGYGDRLLSSLIAATVLQLRDEISPHASDVIARQRRERESQQQQQQQQQHPQQQQQQQTKQKEQVDSKAGSGPEPRAGSMSDSRAGSMPESKAGSMPESKTGSRRLLELSQFESSVESSTYNSPLHLSPALVRRKPHEKEEKKLNMEAEADTSFAISLMDDDDGNDDHDSDNGGSAASSPRKLFRGMDISMIDNYEGDGDGDHDDDDLLLQLPTTGPSSSSLLHGLPYLTKEPPIVAAGAGAGTGTGTNTDAYADIDEGFPLDLLPLSSSGATPVLASEKTDDWPASSSVCQGTAGETVVIATAKATGTDTAASTNTVRPAAAAVAQAIETENQQEQQEQEQQLPTMAQVYVTTVATVSPMKIGISLFGSLVASLMQPISSVTTTATEAATATASTITSVITSQLTLSSSASSSTEEEYYSPAATAASSSAAASSNTSTTARARTPSDSATAASSAATTTAIEVVVEVGGNSAAAAVIDGPRRGSITSILSVDSSSSSAVIVDDDEGIFLKDAESLSLSSPNMLSSDLEEQEEEEVEEEENEEDDNEDYWALDSFQGEWEIASEESLLLLFSSVNNCSSCDVSSSPQKQKHEAKKTDAHTLQQLSPTSSPTIMTGTSGTSASSPSSRYMGTTATTPDVITESSEDGLMNNNNSSSETGGNTPFTAAAAYTAAATSQLQPCKLDIPAIVTSCKWLLSMTTSESISPSTLSSRRTRRTAAALTEGIEDRTTITEHLLSQQKSATTVAAAVVDYPPVGELELDAWDRLRQAPLLPISALLSEMPLFRRLVIIEVDSPLTMLPVVGGGGVPHKSSPQTLYSSNVNEEESVGRVLAVKCIHKMLAAANQEVEVVTFNYRELRIEGMISYYTALAASIAAPVHYNPLADSGAYGYTSSAEDYPPDGITGTLKMPLSQLPSKTLSQLPSNSTEGGGDDGKNPPSIVDILLDAEDEIISRSSSRSLALATSSTTMTSTRDDHDDNSAAPEVMGIPAIDHVLGNNRAQTDGVLHEMPITKKISTVVAEEENNVGVSAQAQRDDLDAKNSSEKNVLPSKSTEENILPSSADPYFTSIKFPPGPSNIPASVPNVPVPSKAHQPTRFPRRAPESTLPTALSHHPMVMAQLRPYSRNNGTITDIIGTITDNNGTFIGGSDSDMSSRERERKLPEIEGPNTPEADSGAGIFSKFPSSLTSTTVGISDRGDGDQQHDHNNNNVGVADNRLRRQEASGLKSAEELLLGRSSVSCSKDVLGTVFLVVDRQYMADPSILRDGGSIRDGDNKSTERDDDLRSTARDVAAVLTLCCLSRVMILDV